MKIDYDNQFDILYCSIGDISNSYGDEIDSNFVVLRDMDTNEVTGVTIMAFEKFIWKLWNDYNAARNIEMSTEFVKDKDVEEETA